MWFYSKCDLGSYGKLESGLNLEMYVSWEIFEVLVGPFDDTSGDAKRAFWKVRARRIIGFYCSRPNIDYVATWLLSILKEIYRNLILFMDTYKLGSDSDLDYYAVT